MRINIPVNTNKRAKRYSVIFFVLISPTNFLNPLPNSAQRLIVGKQIIAAVKVTKATPIKIFSSVGKNPDATVTAIDQAFGFMNWNKDAS